MPENPTIADRTSDVHVDGDAGIPAGADIADKGTETDTAGADTGEANAGDEPDAMEDEAGADVERTETVDVVADAAPGGRTSVIAGIGADGAETGDVSDELMNLLPVTHRSKDLDVSYTQNRELSWLRFNRRVLDEANDGTVPLIERFKFISIFTTNLDEFFMVRVGSLFDLSLIEPAEIDNKTLATPGEQLDAIFEAVSPLVTRRDRVYQRVELAMRKAGIFDYQMHELAKKERKELRTYYTDYVGPTLSPQVVDNRHPFPHLENKRLYIACTLTDNKGRTALGIVPIPDNLPKIVQLTDRPEHFVRIETLIIDGLDDLFEIYAVSDACTVCVTRNADIQFDDDKFDDNEDDYRVHVSRLLKKRKRLSPVRLEVSGETTQELIDNLTRLLELEAKQVYRYNSPLDLTFAFDLARLLPAEVVADNVFPAMRSRYPVGLDRSRPMMEQVREHDVLLFYPYDEMTPFLQLLKEAADDPDVISIKITIYRLAGNSQVAQRLCEAADAGKQVTVLMELRARFDEANNIYWADRLEDAGCQIIYGAEGFKCHSKICLITRREGNGIGTITQIGTGNYNEKTATLYTDLSYITSDEQIGRDGIDFFNDMQIGNLKGDYEKLLIAPMSIKPALMRAIDEQIALGSDGYIRIKCNSVTERDIIDKLAEASQAGVRIDMLVRGICCLLPGIENKTDNITVRSIVGRFLEHSRVYCFGKGADARVLISSADLMTRNITRRVEIACPIENPRIKSEIIEMMDTLFSDTAKARLLKGNGVYKKVKVLEGVELFNAQEYFITHPITHPIPAATAEGVIAEPTAAKANVPPIPVAASGPAPQPVNPSSTGSQAAQPASAQQTPGSVSQSAVQPVAQPVSQPVRQADQEDAVPVTDIVLRQQPALPDPRTMTFFQKLKWLFGKH